MALGNQQPVGGGDITPQETAQIIKDAIKVIRDAVKDKKITDTEVTTVEDNLKILDTITEKDTVGDNVANIREYIPLIDAIKRIAERYRVPYVKAVDILADIKMVIESPLFNPDAVKQLLQMFN